jgi:hypothetical protein
MGTDNEPEIPAPRSTAEIFHDLRTLAQSVSALHEISHIIYRDWVLTVDVRNARVIDAPEDRWSTSKVNKNELMLLVGLMVQSTNDQTYSLQSDESSFAARADQLLHEFHGRLITEAWAFEAGKFVESPDTVGLVGREAIYYGAESFYIHQFVRFGRQRYREDTLWLLENAGLSIRPMLDIAKFIIDRINRQMTDVGHRRRDGQKFSNADLMNSLLIAKTDVRRKFGAKADAFFAKFVTPVTGANRGFTDPFAINEVAIAPIIDLGEHLYVPSQYRLFEAIYESPFYWMMSDKAYADTTAKHRGVFVEQTAAHILRSVFGAENVYENVILESSSRETAGEIDVLVIYGEFAIVVQAKSKRVTLKARAGDTEKLKADFDGAIQAPYRQALSCIDLIKSGTKCLTQDGKELSPHSLPRFFPMVVLSDPFPASTFLSGTMLKRADNIAPVIWDIGVLDCVARLLPTPIEMIFYLKSRSDAFEKVLSDSEYNFLGYHIRTKLVMPPDFTGMVLERDFATVVDDFMIAADMGIEAQRPIGILERLQIPIVSELLARLKGADPRLASVVIDLYDFSSAALEEMSATILKLREEITATGKAIKAFSIPTTTGGLTYAVTRHADANSAVAAEAIGTKHKYDTKSDRWYVILDSVETTNAIDGLLPLVSPWKEDVNEAVNSEQVGRIFNSRRQEVTVGDVVTRGLKSAE